MGKKSPKAPAIPDAQELMKAQTAQNKQTAWYNAMLENMDQYTPYGSLTYEQKGTIDEPKWVSTINLSPEQQKILESQNRQNIALNTLGEGQIDRITGAISSPFSYGGLQNALPTAADINQATTRAEEALMSRINPQFAQQEEALRTRLINQGIGQGSQAYNREMDTFNQAQNDARMQAILGAQQYGSNEQNMALQRRLQEIDEYNTMRNAPLNEYIGLTSGTQIQNPQFSSRGNSGIQPFDIAGAMTNQYNNQLAQYSNQQAAANNRSGAMSSLFGMGGQLAGNYLAREGGALAGSAFAGPVGGFLGSAAGSLFSDERLKDNMELIGEENGYPIYRFNYLGSDKVYEGVKAQDVKVITPEAVSEVNGFMKVDYDMIGVEMRAVQ